MQTKNIPAPEGLLSALDDICNYVLRQSFAGSACSIDVRPYAKNKPQLRDLRDSLSAHAMTEATHLSTLFSKEVRRASSLERLTPTFLFYAYSPSITAFSIIGDGFSWGCPFRRAHGLLSLQAAKHDAILSRFPDGPLKNYSVHRSPTHFFNSEMEYLARNADEAIALYALVHDEEINGGLPRGVTGAHLICPDAQ